MLGNWSSIGTDLDGDGNATDPGETDTRTHNMANEMLTRSLNSTLPSPFNYAYDAAGNATEITTGLNAKRRYTHDAWNRLVKAESGTVSGGTTTWTTTGQYQYNGLHWRVVADSDRATPTGLDRRTYMYYSAGWQLLQEDIDDHSNGGSPDGVNSRSQEVWGLRYIDDAMVRLIDKNLDGDSRDSGELFWQLSDAQFSSVAVIDKNAVLQERVSYTAYGVGTHRWPHEVNNTGGVTTSGSTSDYGVIDGLAQANSGAGTPIDDLYGNYNVAADLNRDGVVDSTDTSIFTSTFGGAKSALASGTISDPNGPDNVFGYDGYVYNPDQGLYTVRFRWYSASYGRWLQRDPAGYVDGMNYYEYASGSTTSFADPSGLYVGVNGGKNFRSAVEKALSRLCPGTKVKQNGRLEIPKPDEKPKNEGGGEVCDAEECNNPPGCELLRKLEETNYAIPIVETGGEPGTDLQWERNEEESGIVHPTINYNPKYNRPIDKRRGDGQRVIDRNAEAWETLWHELVHVDRSRRGLHPLRWGVNDKDLTPLQRAIEELETIEATNKLYDWERKCVKLPEIMGPEKPGRPRLEQPVHPANRDPWGHPFVDPVWRDTQNYPGIRKME